MMRFWTTAEEAILREHYKTLGPRACAERIGRSYWATINRAAQLGLTDDRRTAQMRASERRLTR